MTEDGRTYMKIAIDEASRCEPEDKDRSHPKVGAVIVKNGTIISAHRGEKHSGDHAEYTALDLKDQSKSAGSTVYTTLEPCTTRRHPKEPCVDRIIGHRVKRVVVGMLDPNPTITGKGILRLRECGIEVTLFDPDMMRSIEELNRDFINSYRPIQGAILSGSIPSNPAYRSLDDWYRVINAIYLNRNYYREPSSIFSHLVEVIGGLGILASDYTHEKQIIAKYLPKGVAWWMGLCGRVGVKSISDMLWAKFPFICPYCQTAPHDNTRCRQIKVQNPDPDWAFVKAKVDGNISSKPKNLGEWQRMFQKVYKIGDGEDYRLTLAKLTEELGELAEAVRAFHVKPGYFLNEAADVFSWIMHLANVYESRQTTPEEQIGQHFEKMFSTEYLDRCSKCQNQRCTCPAFQPETLGKLARQTPLSTAELLSTDKIFPHFGLG
jgi:pyrimidine deaminase RibD-like protein/NTP pyrophosphatase (non-canonical NTP hydrolase)